MPGPALSSEDIARRALFLPPDALFAVWKKRVGFGHRAGRGNRTHGRLCAACRAVFAAKGMAANKRKSSK